MSVSVEVPALGESVTEAIVAEWLKKEGDFVEEDEVLVELETDKITVSVPSPVAGVVTSLKADLEDSVEVGEIIAEIDPDGERPSGDDSGDEEEAEESRDDREEADDSDEEDEGEGEGETSASGTAEEVEAEDVEEGRSKIETDSPLSPSVKRLLEEHDLSASDVEGSGPNGRILKGDVLDYVERGAKEKIERTEAPAPPQPEGQEPEERVKMSRLRQTVAKRLVDAQQNAAMLTTFQECDMSAVMKMRGRFKEKFVDRYDIKLGFMSFFVKAAINALKEFPAVNSEIDGDHIVYKHYYHIGVAVGGPKGLVVPVIKHADQMSFAEVEQEIQDLARKVQDNKISMDDLQGGTFTISNGGIYGSMLSTPILNPPQVGILGMHNIVERPVVVDGEVEVRPVMYLALSYDHRIIDGKEAVSFLKRIKECIEEPERILLEI